MFPSNIKACFAKLPPPTRMHRHIHGLPTALTCTCMHFMFYLMCLCAVPAPWSFCWKTAQFCLSSRPICEAFAHCGDQIDSFAECQTAATRLRELDPPLQACADVSTISNTATEISDPLAPPGCFLVCKEGRVYYNPSGAIDSGYDFSKAICHSRNTTGLPQHSRALPRPSCSPLPRLAGTPCCTVAAWHTAWAYCVSRCLCA